jgi:hypothetical protein
LFGANTKFHFLNLACTGFQRGAKYLVDHKSIFKNPHHRESRHEQRNQDLEGDFDPDLEEDTNLESNLNQQKGLPHFSKSGKSQNLQILCASHSFPSNI